MILELMPPGTALTRSLAAKPRNLNATKGFWRSMTFISPKITQPSTISSWWWPVQNSSLEPCAFVTSAASSYSNCSPGSMQGHGAMKCSRWRRSEELPHRGMQPKTCRTKSTWTLNMYISAGHHSLGGKGIAWILWTRSWRGPCPNFRLLSFSRSLIHPGSRRTTPLSGTVCALGIMHAFPR